LIQFLNRQSSHQIPAIFVTELYKPFITRHASDTKRVQTRLQPDAKFCVSDRTKKETHMKSVFKPVLIAALLATAGFAAFSQSPMRGDCDGMMGAGGAMHQGMHHDRMGKMDPAKMQSWMDKRNASLKAVLKLTAAQEGAWTTYTAAMKPPVGMMGTRPDRAEMEKLTTPERIDKMKALHTQRMTDMNAVMEKHGEATKAFYATLTPEQQKVFDANAMPRQGRDGRKGGMRDGKGPGQPAPQPASPASK
jgi:protein CpxP